MKCTDYIAKKLSNYTDCAFIGQGGSVVHLLDSLSKLKNFKIIPSQNEQGASLAADAYARCTGKVGLVVATSGPGIINAFQGMACSYYDSIPGIYISGAPVRSMLRKSNKLRSLGFQEMDVVNIVKSFTKYSVRITDINRVDYEIEKCLKIALEGRQGPCLVDLPDDIQRSSLETKKQKKFFYKKIKVNKKYDVAKFKKLLERSKKPLIIVGQGVVQSKTEKKISELIKKFQIPFTCTWGAYGLFPELSKYNAGSFGVYASNHGNLAINNSDLLLIFGSRLSGPLIGTKPEEFGDKAKKIQIDIDNAELQGENRVKIDLKIQRDLKVFFNSNPFKYINIRSSQEWNNQISNWKKEFPNIKKNYFKQKKFVNPYIFFNKLGYLLNKNDVLINDSSANLCWSYQSLGTNFKSKTFTSFNASPMGYSVPAAIGASIAERRKNIIAVTGDGAMQMNIQEIENISSMKLPIKIILINNDGYGLMRQTIDTWLKSNYVGCDKKSGLSLPDFKKVFKAYGIDSITIKNNSQIEKSLKKVLRLKKPILCEVMVHPNAHVIPKVKPGFPLHIMLDKVK